ncbi:hypothetical protein EV368DRAFT_84741 [Lentinula lateritia]|nr:hypothetical protein EV368DRAFT_84741 [Lentinula lateritia]
MVTPMDIGSEDMNSINVTGQGHGVEVQDFWSGQEGGPDRQTLFLLGNSTENQAREFEQVPTQDKLVSSSEE